MSPFRSLLNYQLLFGLDLLFSIFFSPLLIVYLYTCTKKKPGTMIHSSRSSKRVIYISFPPFFPVFETKLHGSLPSIGTSGQCQVKGLCGNYWIHKWMIKILHLAPVIQEWPYSWPCTTAKSNLVEMLEMWRNILTLLRVWIFKEGSTCYISLH